MALKLTIEVLIRVAMWLDGLSNAMLRTVARLARWRDERRAAG
ncbi:MAG TPA: hypothetical protein VIQ53_09765 [Inquilinus sp.]